MRVSFRTITSIILLLWYCSATDALSLKQTTSQKDSRIIDSLPRPNDREIDKIRSASEWHNPYVIVCPDGYELVLHDQPRTNVQLSLNELEKSLLKLPLERWPLGKVVAVQEIGLRSPGDDTGIQLNLKAVIRMLRSYKLRVDRWPSG